MQYAHEGKTVKFIPITSSLFVQKEDYTLVSDKIAFPQHYLDDLVYVADLYGAKVELRPFSSDGYAGGYNAETKLCYINIPDAEYTVIPTLYAVRVFCHELAHHLQRNNLGVTSPSSFTGWLLFEQEANKIGHALNLFYFPEHPNELQYTLEHYYLGGKPSEALLAPFMKYHYASLKDTEEDTEECIQAFVDDFNGETLPQELYWQKRK